MLSISHSLSIPLNEIELTQIRASGPGGQHVNKVATAVHLRFDSQTSSLPNNVKQQLMRLGDRRISSNGVVVIKAQQFRSLEQNKEDALKRLALLISAALKQQKKRIATRPSQAARRRRLALKQQQSSKKTSRRKIWGED